MPTNGTFFSNESAKYSQISLINIGIYKFGRLSWLGLVA